MLHRVAKPFVTTAFIALGLLLAIADSLAAPANNTLVVISAEGGVYEEIVEQLEQGRTLQPGQYQVTGLVDESRLKPLIESAAAIITIGTRAAEAVYQHKPQAPILSALITESGFSFLAEKHYGSIVGALRRGVSAIYLDQPLARLYYLGRLLLPDARHIGVITSDVSSSDVVNGFSVEQAEGVQISTVMLASDSRPITVLNPLMTSSDFVIALPGKKSTTLAAAKWVLKIGSHTRTPVIAFSRKYAKSGALAAVYTSPANVAEQIARILEETQALRAGPAGVFPPGGFSIEINTTVAGTLGIPLADSAYYRAQIRQLEGNP